MSGSSDLRPAAGRLARTWESSRVLGGLRRIVRGSLLYAALTRLGRSLSGQSSWIGTWLARHPPSRDFPHATRLIATSALFGAIERFFIVTARAWQGSTAKRVVVDQTIAPLEPWQRVRLVGWVIIVAAITHAGLSASTLLDNWRARLVWALMLGVGVTMVAACRPVAAAWRNWRRPPDPSA